jgi:hypothetical protein
MRLLIVIVGLAAIAISAPALAEPPNYTWGNAMAARAQAPYGYGSARYSYGSAMGRSIHSSNPAFDVYNSRGEYVGSDPDPRIRATLQAESRGRER